MTVEQLLFVTRLLLKDRRDCQVVVKVNGEHRPVIGWNIEPDEIPFTGEVVIVLETADRMPLAGELRKEADAAVIRLGLRLVPPANSAEE